MKPKRGPSSLTQESPINVPNQFDNSNNTVLAQAVSELRTSVRVEDLQRVLKFLPLDTFNEGELAFVASLVAYLFLTVEAKHPIRKTISRLLSQIQGKVAKNGLIFHIKNLLNDCLTDNCNYEKYNDVLFGLLHCFCNFPLGIEAISETVDIVTVFAIELFEKLVEKLSGEKKRTCLHGYMHNAAKLLVAVLQQCPISEVFPEYCPRLMVAAYKVIMDDFVTFDTKSNCGLVMVIAVIHAPENVPDGMEYKTNPCLSLLKFDQCENDDTFDYKEFSKNYTANLCLYSGILNVVPQNLLCEEVVHGVPVISFMFGKLLACAKRCTGKPIQILEVSRSLILISKVMNTIPLNIIEPMFSQGLEYVWTHLDHYIDTVKQSARIVFENLVKLAYKYYKDGFKTLLKLILTNMIDLLVNRNTHYVALTIMSSVTGCSFLLEQFSHLPFILLINMQDPALSQQISHTYEILMSQHKNEESEVDKWLELWVDLIKPLLTRCKGHPISYYQRLLVNAYRLQPLVIKSIMHYQWSSGANELGALLACLRTAKMNSYVVPHPDDGDLTEDEHSLTYWRGIIEHTFLEIIVFHESEEIRLHTLALVVENPRSTESFSPWELGYLTTFFKYNVNLQTSSTRHEMIALYKKAFLRIKHSFENLIRYSALKPGPSASIEVKQHVERARSGVTYYKEFMRIMLEDHIFPGFQMDMSHYRRATCLEMLLYIVTEKCVDDQMLKQFWKPCQTFAIMDCLYDSYEVNMKTTFQIIKNLPFSIFDHCQGNVAVSLNIRQTIYLASSVKPSSVLAAGYALQLYLTSPFAKEVLSDMVSDEGPYDNVHVLATIMFLNRVKSAVGQSKTNLVEAIKTTSFYGDLLCVRNIIESNNLCDTKHWGFLVSQIISTCKMVMEVVSPIVNNYSPEGYIPDRDLTQPFHIAVMSQMFVVYAWRSVKEVSLLLGELPLRAPVEDPVTGKSLITKDILLMIEKHFIDVFMETKHRGAYEQSSVGLNRFCHYLWTKCDKTEYRLWPMKWLENFIKVLRGEDDKILNKLCPTRRSAGLPFMVTAIVTNEPKDSNGEIFHFCMQSMLDIATNDSQENMVSKVHAINILRALFRHHQLGEAVTTYVSDGIKIALSAFNSDEWKIRNAGMLLLASLIQRVFGVQRSKEVDSTNHKNKMSTKVFFMRYPELYQCFLDHLISGTASDKNAMVLYPVLILLERLYPCNTEEETQLGEYLVYVNKCLQSPIYYIRELAAQASASLIPNLEVVSYIKKLLIKLSDVTLSDNYCQGLISQITCLLKSLNKGHTALNAFGVIDGTFWIAIATGRYISHYTGANYYNMLTSLTSKFPKDFNGSPGLVRLVKIIIWQGLKDSGPCDVTLTTAKKRYFTAKFNLHAHIVQNLYMCDAYFKSLYLKELILQGITSNYNDIIVFCFNYISYLFMDHPKYQRNSMFETEHLEISQPEYKLVTSLEPVLKEYMLENIHYKFKSWLMDVFEDLLTRSDEVLLAMLLALQYFPCVLNKIGRTRQQILEQMLQWCEYSDEIFCAVLSCLSNYLPTLTIEELRDELDCIDLYRSIFIVAKPNHPEYLRMGAAQFLVQNRRLFMEKELYDDPELIADMWRTVVQLLDDDSLTVRQIISQLTPEILRNKNPHDISTKFDKELFFMSVKAKEVILDYATEILPPKIAIPLFFSWILRFMSTPERKKAELFDVTSVNQYYEEKILEKLTLAYFKNLLWRLDQDITYENKSIFIEEHVQLVTTIIYNNLFHHLPQTVSPNARVTLLCVVKKIREFVDRCTINTPNFVEQLNAVIVNEFANLASVGRQCQSNNPDIGRLQDIMKFLFDIKVKKS